MRRHLIHTSQVLIFCCATLSLSACKDNASVNGNTANVVSVSPSEALPGETITVEGRNFGVTKGAKSLDINGIPATEITSWTDTQIVATTPDGASTGNVTVTDNGESGDAAKLVVPWLFGNPGNVKISSLPTPQDHPQLAPDGSHGAIITWADWRNSTSGHDIDIYAQRVNNQGYPLWPADNGVPVIKTAFDQSWPQIASDGAGGAIIVWQDKRNDESDIYAQRIDRSGAIQWGESGVAISVAANLQNEPRIIADGEGGAIIAWTDARDIPKGETTGSVYSDWNIYAQRINHAGEAQWAENGVAVTSAAYYQRWPELISDGDGGAIITWDDQRGSTETHIEKYIYAQRINSVGEPQWTPDGEAISVAGYDEWPRLISDGHGGAIIVWDGSRDDPYADVFAQRINGSGVVQWTENGVAISTAAYHQRYPRIATDGMGGAIITWMDERDSATTNSDIYAQRVNAGGVVQWLKDGVPVCTLGNYQSVPKILSDGKGGATILWEDMRNGDKDIYAQRVNSSGTAQWVAGGIAVSSATGDQDVLQASPITDGVGGVIVTWQDLRNGRWDVYAQGITYGGRL